jgi:cytochrome c biogenesis protein
MSTFREPSKLGSWLWGSLTSIRLTVSLLLILALVAIIGTVLPQDQPPGYYLHRFGEALGSLLWRASLGRIYYSPWFLGPVGLLAVNILACLIHGLPQAVRRSCRRFTWEMAVSLPERGRFQWRDADHPQARLTGILRQELGSPHRETLPDKEVYFYERGHFRPLGPYLVHLALLLVLTGGLIGKFWSIEGQLTLPEGQTAQTFDLDGLKKEQPLNFQVRLDRFQVRFYQDGTPQEYRSDLSFSRDGQEAARAVCRVNEPVSFGGLTFYQASYGVQPAGPIVLNLSRDGVNQTLEAPLRRPVDLPDGQGQIMIVRLEGDLQGYGPGVQLAYKRGPEHPQVFWVLKDHPDLPEQPGPYRFTVVALPLQYYSVFQVKHDPGVGWVYAGFLLLLPGFYLAFFRPSQRWAVVLEKSPKGGWQGTLRGASPRAREAFAARQERLLALLKKGTPS